MNKSSIFHDLFNLQGKTALVTGGGSGIGLHISKVLSFAGAKVFITSRNIENMVAACKEINNAKPTEQVEFFPSNLDTELGIDLLVKDLKNRSSKLDILVNNSGVTWGSEPGNFPYFAWDRVMKINVTALFHLSQALIPMLKRSVFKKNPSRILNVGSVMGSIALGGGPYSYSASKAAVHQITRILAKELAKDFITVNAFAPGPFSSKMTAFAMDSEEKKIHVANNVPLGRIGSAEDIASATLYICGPGGSYVTGAIIPIDGGIHIATGPEIFE